MQSIYFIYILNIFQIQLRVNPNSVMSWKELKQGLNDTKYWITNILSNKKYFKKQIHSNEL